MIVCMKNIYMHTLFGAVSRQTQHKVNDKTLVHAVVICLSKQDCAAFFILMHIPLVTVLYNQ